MYMYILVCILLDYIISYEVRGADPDAHLSRLGRHAAPSATRQPYDL